MELEINGKAYNFKFGIGFLREVNSKQKVKTADGNERELGFAYMVGGLMDGNILDLCEMLYIANKTETPRVDKKELEDYLDDENTDIDKLFTDTIDFLSKSNACKTQIKQIQKAIETDGGKGAMIPFPIRA